MKKISIYVYAIILIALVSYYININKTYDNLRKKSDKLTNNVLIDNKIKDLKTKNNQLLLSISQLVNKDNLKYNDVKLMIDSYNNSYNSLVADNTKKQEIQKALTNQKEIIEAEYNKLLQEELKKKTFMINGVATINQYAIGYPMGCESVALTILLKYWNVDVSVSDVVNILPKGDLPHYEDGIKYGGNHYIEFIGNPTDPHSYGVLDGPIIKMANTFKEGIISDNGKSLDDILKIVREGRPVLVWNSMYLAVPYISNSWIYKPTGERINWLSSLHAIVIVGYTDTQVITSDSLTGTIKYYNRKTFESRYNAFGKRALYY